MRVIGGRSFIMEGCITQMQQTVLPEGLVQISDEAFLNCGLLESITIPAGVQRIGENAHFGNTKSKKIHL